MLHAARILHATFVYFKVIFPSLGGPYVKRNGVFLEIVHKPDSVVLCTCNIVTILLLQLNKFFFFFFRIYADDFLLIFKKFTYGAAIILGLGQYRF